MENNPSRWIEVLRNSHDNLTAIVGPLSTAQLEQPSYDTDWSIAQVLSHLGSSAEIFQHALNAALAGGDPPGMVVIRPIWDTWNAKSAQRQADDSLLANEELVRRLEGLSADDLDRMRVRMFGIDLGATDIAAMRVSEHAVHTWDAAVALDSGATVAADAVELLVDRVGQVAARYEADGVQRRIRVGTSDPSRRFVVESGEAISVIPDSGDGAGQQPDLSMPAEAFVRLVYGRLDKDHTPPLEAGDVDLDDLRGLFPGF